MLLSLPEVCNTSCGPFGLLNISIDAPPKKSVKLKNLNNHKRNLLQKILILQKIYKFKLFHLVTPVLALYQIQKIYQKLINCHFSLLFLPTQLPAFLFYHLYFLKSLFSLSINVIREMVTNEIKKEI